MSAFVLCLPQFAAFTSLGVICISTFCFILSTFPELQEDEEFEEEEEPPDIFLSEGNISTTPSAVIDLSALFDSQLFDYTFIKSVLKIVDLITVVYFCTEYILRFICCPDKKKFFLQVRSVLICL